MLCMRCQLKGFLFYKYVCMLYVSVIAQALKLRISCAYYLFVRGICVSSLLSSSSSILS